MHSTVTCHHAASSFIAFSATHPPLGFHPSTLLLLLLVYPISYVIAFTHYCPDQLTAIATLPRS